MLPTCSSVSFRFLPFLSQERGTRWVIRSVYVGVTIGAAAIEILDRTKRLWLGGVPAAVVARVAHPWHSYFQQLGVVRAVRFVAVRAILHHWRVLPEKGPASFALDELFRIRRAMRIVAAGTGDFAFAIRHMRRTL